LDFSDLCFQDADKAREWLEAQRWPNGATCPHCGNADPTKITGLKGKACRPGLYHCAECHGQFTVTVGSVIERSKIPLNKWLLAMHLIGSSKKGRSVRQLQRRLGIAYLSAWSHAQRIREAIRTLPGCSEAAGKSLKQTKPISAKLQKQQFPRRTKGTTTVGKVHKAGALSRR
jgi:transposase-like protein